MIDEQLADLAQVIIEWNEQLLDMAKEWDS